MKKLIMAVAIVGAVASVKAASVAWDNYDGGVMQYAAGGSETPAQGYVAYFFAGVDVSDFSVFEKRGDAFNAALAKGYVADSLTDASGIIDQSADFDVPSFDDYKGKAQDAYVVVFNANSADKADHFFVMSDTQSITEATGGITTFMFNGEDSSSGSSWNAIQSVPEPTSGLLLLLGVAGLALRRRRA